MAVDVEFELQDLKCRVGELEGAFGFLTQQTKALHRDLLGFQAETRDEFKAVRKEMRDEFKSVRTEMRDEFKAVRKEIQDLRNDMPGIVGEAMRDVLREKNGR